MQDPNEDTEWNAVLRQKGILPPKEKEVNEEDIVNLVEETVQEKIQGGKQEKQLADLSVDELDLLEDEEDERVLLEYRKKRIAEMKEAAMKEKFGDVREISAEDYVEQVNKAGDNVWVILHLYKPGIPHCTLINNYLNQLAPKFRATKFLKSVSDTCVPNFPEKNLPTIFVYFEGNMRKKFIGSAELGGMNLKCDELEWMLSEVGAVKTDLEGDPRKKTRDVLFSSLQCRDEDADDW